MDPLTNNSAVPDAPELRQEELPASAPKRIGKYRVDGLIGRGSMGIVFRGYDEQIDRPLAIKTIRVEMIADVDRKALLERFGREARAAGRCLHPNIVTVFDYVEQDGAPYIVMEFVDAGTLDAVIRSRTTLPLRQIGEIGTQLLFAMGHAHSKGVIHRDVKPANILCPSAASVKVTDFGVARLDLLGATSPGLAGVGTIGTPNYMSPEQFFGKQIDGRSDLFSVGVVLYQLLTFERPFAATSLLELKEKLLQERPIPVSALRPELPKELDAVLDKALARNPEDRFQTSDAFIDALADAIDAAPSDINEPLDLTEIAPSASALIAAAEGSMTMTMAETLDRGTVQHLEGALAKSLGPIARLVLRKACERATDPQQLLDALSAKIPSEREASWFRALAEETLRADAGLAGIQLETAISESELDSVIDALTSHIGPVARVMASKSAKHAMGVEDLYQRLAAAIPDEGERAAFLAKRPSKVAG